VSPGAPTSTRLPVLHRAFRDSAFPRPDPARWGAREHGVVAVSRFGELLTVESPISVQRLNKLIADTPGLVVQLA
jgi:hypothetical protein